MGARNFLIAYNVNLIATKEQAHRIALDIREQGRGDKVSRITNPSFSSVFFILVPFSNIFFSFFHNIFFFLLSFFKFEKQSSISTLHSTARQVQVRAGDRLVPGRGESLSNFHQHHRHQRHHFIPLKIFFSNYSSL